MACAQGSPPADAAPEAQPLGKHEELSTGCTCGPKHLRLRSDQGQLVTVRGGCVNRCDYCAKLAAVENCEMLIQDALEGDAPQIIAILGTRTATLDMEAFARAREFVVRAVRKRWPDAQYAYEVEYTTGYGPKAGGVRRPHWNWFWKGVPREDVAEFEAIVVDKWCEYVDAEPHAQYVAEIRNEIGLTKYVTEHFMKESQRPPEGFTGQRFCASRGYFRGITVRVARQRAREALRRKRELWKADQAGMSPHDAELHAHQALELAARTVWVLTNDRGARVGASGLDGRRMALPSDRDRYSTPGALPAPVMVKTEERGQLSLAALDPALAGLPVVEGLDQGVPLRFEHHNLPLVLPVSEVHEVVDEVQSVVQDFESGGGDAIEDVGVFVGGRGHRPASV